MHAIRPEQRPRRGRASASVRLHGPEIGLAQHHVRRGVAAVRPRVPDQHAMVPSVRHRHPVANRCDAGRHVQRRGSWLAFGVAPLAGEVGLPDDPVRRRVVADRHGRPAEQPMVAGVADPERAARPHQARAARPEQGFGARHDRDRQPVKARDRTQAGQRPGAVQHSQAGRDRRVLQRRLQGDTEGGGHRLPFEPHGDAAPAHTSQRATAGMAA